MEIDGSVRTRGETGVGDPPVPPCPEAAGPAGRDAQEAPWVEVREGPLNDVVQNRVSPGVGGHQLRGAFRCAEAGSKGPGRGQEYTTPGPVLYG